MLFLEDRGASMPSLLQYVFSYILGAVLLFQGLHFFMEGRAPLGTLPEETQQTPTASRTWGVILLVWSVTVLGIGLLSHFYADFRPAVVPFFYLGLVLLVVFSAWVVFMGRTIEFMGKPSADDHGHAVDHGHH
jgi:hypothetical protein